MVYIFRNEVLGVGVKVYMVKEAWRVRDEVIESIETTCYLLPPALVFVKSCLQLQNAWAFDGVSANNKLQACPEGACTSWKPSHYLCQ